jgi:hypothetical protein
VARNHGCVFIGTSADTSEFAVEAICHWLRTQGRRHYPKAKRLLILADAGGSNNCRYHLWKREIQQKVANEFALDVTVCHFATGASKWNPVEHRLFGPISCQWAGMPLRSLDLMVECIRKTKTKTGLRVCVKVTTKRYPKGIEVSKDERDAINLKPHKVCPIWNYTIECDSS